MPTPEEIEAADVFLGKAASDLAAARLLAGDDEQDDDVVGFHAQQAVEKALKAVMAVRSLEIPRTHDFGVLIRMLDSPDDELPVEIRQADWLNPWAVALRYDHPGATLDRGLAMEVPKRACVGLGTVSTRLEGMRMAAEDPRRRA